MILYENDDDFIIEVRRDGIDYYYRKITEAMVKYGIFDKPEIDKLKEIAKVILEYTSTKKFRRKSYYRREAHNARENFVYYVLKSIINMDLNKQNSTKLRTEFFEGLLSEIEQERSDFDFELFTS